MSAWAKFPTTWIIQDKTLNALSWQKYKSDATVALLILMALVIKRNIDNMGISTEERAKASPDVVGITYDQIQTLVCISRSKVSKGLALLMQLKIIERSIVNRSFYKISGLGEAGQWAKLPQRRLMSHNRISAFETFTLRTKSELNALKLYLLMIAFRSSTSSYAHLGYSKLTEYAGVMANDIMKAKSHLINLGLISVDYDFDNAKDKSKPPLRYKLHGLQS